MKEENKASNVAKVAVVFQKLPFLQKHYDPKTIDKVSINEINASALDRDCGYHKGKFIDHIDALLLLPVATSPREYLEKEILLFSKDGKLVGQVGIKPTIDRKTWWIFQNKPPEVPFQETIREALERLGMEKVFYITCALTDKNSRRLIIDRPLEGLDIKRTIEKEFELASKELRLETASAQA